MPRLGGRGLWLGLAAAAVAAMIARLTGWWSPRADFRLFIPEELARYRGRPGDPGLYLALLGRVYDVSSGRRHYEPGAPYSGFAGISRAAPAVSCYDAGGLPTAFHSFTHSFVPSFIHLLFFFLPTFVRPLWGPFSDTSSFWSVLTLAGLWAPVTCLCPVSPPLFVT